MELLGSKERGVFGQLRVPSLAEEIEVGRDLHIPMIRCRQLLLTILKQLLQALYPLVARYQLALGDRDLLLQRGVLLDELPLHDGELLEIALEEHHLLLLGSVVRGTQDVVVLLAGFI